MKGEKSHQSRNKLQGLLWMVMATCIAFTGCAPLPGPVVLNYAVRQYDDNVVKSEKELLLLNIIRMHNYQPPHFTVSSDVKATFVFTAGSSGINPSFSSGSGGNTFAFSLNSTVSDNPTITIAPMQGKEFANRLLKPIDIPFANTLLLQQSQQMDKTLRLIGANFVMVGPKAAETVKAPYPQEVVQYLQSNGCFPKENPEQPCLLQNRPQMKPPIPDNLERFTGDIKNVDKVAKTITVAEEKEEKTFATDDNTKVVGAKKDITFADLSTEMSVYVDYRTERDRLIADRIAETDKRHYKLFRQLVLHIKAMQLSGRLQLSVLDFDREIEGTFRTAKEMSSTGIKDTTDAFEKEYHWKKISTPATKEEKEKEGFILTKSDREVKGTFMPVKGNGKDMKDIILALGKQYNWKNIPNPDPNEEGFILTKRYQITALMDIEYAKIYAKMCEQDKEDLLKNIREDLGLNDYLRLDQGVVIVLFRGDEHNHWPIYGLFTLRNFIQLLQFLAESLKDQPLYEREYSVDPSRFTKALLPKDINCGEFFNPPLTLTIFSGKKVKAPEDSVVDVKHNGEYFWVFSPAGQPVEQPLPTSLDNQCFVRWNEQVFSLLYEIFQINRVEPPVSPPSISISK